MPTEPTDLERLQTIRSQTLAQLVELRADPKPTYWLDDQRVLWSEYAEALQRTVDWCDRQLAAASPFEIHTKGTTG